jgi:UDP-glucose 4-epimerase
MIGSTIAEQLAVTDVGEILVLDNFVRGRMANLETALESGKVTVIDGDIRDQRTVKRAMAGIDVVFHQAAIRITQCAEQPRQALEVMVDGTYNVLEATVEAQVKRVVAASSASVYGAATQFPTPESHHPYGNRTLYGASKTFNEGLLRSFHDMYGLSYMALRYFNVYGPKMDIYGVYTEVLIRWMERIAAGQPPLIMGDGRQTMDFVYVADVARANILAAESSLSDEVINVASGQETSLLELASALTKVMDSDLGPEFAPERKVNAVPRRLADTTAAQQLLGFEPETSLMDGLRHLVDWWSRERSDLAAGAVR